MVIDGSQEDHQSLGESSIDGKFSILKRFGAGEELNKQVYLVVCTTTKRKLVAKVFMDNE